MQIQKVDIRKGILEIARQEFFNFGFKDTSMRTIAKKSGVGLSNIYNYFKNKDEIFKEVLTPLLSTLQESVKIHNSPKNITIEYFTSEKHIRSDIDLMVGLITQFKQELNLLLFNAHGSKLQGFVEEVLESHTRMGLEYIKLMNEKYPNINTNISEFFIHTMSSWWITIIGELVSHDLSYTELECFVTEYIGFATGGWQRIMNA